MASGITTVNLQSLFHELSEESKALRNTRLITKRLLSSGEHGNFRSSFRGQGLQLRNLREYNPGDDVRHIHWSASARSQRVQLKTFEDEKTLRVVVLLDVSPSVLCDRKFIANYFELFALLAAVCGVNKDLLGFGFFSSDLKDYTAPVASRKALQLFKKAISKISTQNKSLLSQSLRSFVKMERTRSLLIIVSDFAFGDIAEAIHSVAVHHNVVGVVRPIPPLPEAGLIQLEDSEDGTINTVDCGDSGVRRAYEEAWNSQVAKLSHIFRGVGGRFLTLKSPVETVRELAKKRR